MHKLTETELQERRAGVVRAASEVFQRYGYARTTMVDLAAAARVSRPILYELFPSKELIFAAVVHHLSQSTLNGYRELLPKLRSLRAKLLRFCGDWGTHGLRLVERYPDAKDLFDLDVPAVREMYEDFISFLVEIIASEQKGSLPQIVRLVRNLVYSLKGLTAAAGSVRQMEEMIALQVEVFLKAL